MFKTGSTIAPPPKPAIFSNERFMAARHEDGCYEVTNFICIFVCKGLSNDDVGLAKEAPYFRRYGGILVSKPAISLKKS